jgi:hypothetical protein
MNPKVGTTGKNTANQPLKPSVVVAPRTELAVVPPNHADSFEATHHHPKRTDKNQPSLTATSAQMGWRIGGGVLLAGLVALGIWKREALLQTWEKLFKKVPAEMPKSSIVNEKPKATPIIDPIIPPVNPLSPTKPPVIEPIPSTVPATAPSLMTESLQAQLEALPLELKPDVTAYDLTNKDQFNELRIYVQGLHELREKPDTKTLCTAINKICSSIGSNNNDCAWMSRAQARRLTGTIENGKPIGKDIDPMLPHVFGYSLLPPQYLELTERFGKKTLEMQGTMPFQEKFRLEEHPLGSNYYIPDPSQAITGGVSNSRSYNEVEQLLKEQENGSLFFLTHNPFEDSNEGHATMLANINGEIYFIDNAIEGTWAYTFDDFFKQKLINFEGLSESEKRTPDKVFTRETVLNRMTSAINLNIRKFENLKLHPWLLNEAS